MKKLLGALKLHNTTVVGRPFRTFVYFTLLLLLTGCISSSRGTDTYLVLVSIDGFRHDYATLAPTPALDRIASNGVRATALQPVFPTMTFPNHYSIATGLYPCQHGIVGNDFPNAERSAWYSLRDRDTVQDGSWYGGEPLWVTAEKHGLTAGAFFFVGTEAPIQGISPTYWRSFDASIPGTERVDQVLAWLQLPSAERPRLLTLYFEDVDDAAHDYGPGSEELRQAVTLADSYLLRLLDGIDRLGFADQAYVVVVSDHGQAAWNEKPPFVLSEHVDLDGFVIRDHSSYVELYNTGATELQARQLVATINHSWHHGRAYTRREMPSHWRVTEDRRFADVVVMAEPGHAVISRPGRSINKGNHGYDPAAPDMHGIFYAQGPALPPATVIDQVHSVDIYPLMAAALGLSLPANYQLQHQDLRRLLQ